MRKIVKPAGLLLLVSCASPYYEGRDEYHEGMYRMRYDPAAAREHLSRAASYMGEALEDGLDLPAHITALSIRLRALIETDRHKEAGELLGQKLPGFDPERTYEGDTLGLALIRIAHLDPERAYADLLLAERRAGTLRARVHAAWQQVRVLREIGTDKAKAEAIKICEQNAGRLDFDEQKMALRSQ